jgi:hypothetical protein
MLEPHLQVASRLLLAVPLGIRHSWRAPLVGLAILCGALPARLSSQQSTATDSTPERGIAASGALGFKVGGAELQRAGGAQLVGVELDLGHFQSPLTRFQLESTFLRGDLAEFVELEDATYAGHIYDLTGSIVALQLLRPASRRVIPFLSGGVSVHAMASSFGSTILDRRYNTNNFGAHAGIGVRVRLGRSGSRALALELRRTTVRDMNRVSISIGLLRLMRDLAKPLGS